MHIVWTDKECARIVHLLNALATMDKVVTTDKVIIQHATTSLAMVTGNFRTGVEIKGD